MVCNYPIYGISIEHKLPYLCHILKQRKLNTDIYGKDCEEVDGISR